MMRGKVTAVDASGVYVQTAEYGTLGPCQAVVANYTVGDMVLCVNVGDEASPELVVVGQLSAAGSAASIPDGSITSAKIANGTIVDEDVSSSAAISRSKISGLPTSSTDNTVARYDGTGGALQGSSVGIEDSGRITGVATPTGSTDAATKGYVDAAIPIGAVVPYAGSTAPTGWLLCYGQAVSRSTYATLFGIISTTYGTGDGSTTFNVPDLRGRVVAGLDNMGGSDAGRLDWANTLGTAGGVQNNSYADYTNGGAYNTIPGRNAMQPTMLLNHIIRAV